MDRPVFRCVFWRLAGRWLFRMSLHTAHRYRRTILRLAGASVAGSVKIRRSVEIDCPWNLHAGALAIFGDDAILRASSRIDVGQRCVISQMTILTTEQRDASQPDAPVQSAPIVVEDDCWVAADSLVLPGSTVREGAVVGARSVVAGDTPAWTVCAGHPLRGLKQRDFKVAAGTAGSSARQGNAS